MNSSPFGANLSEKSTRPPINRQKRKMTSREAVFLFGSMVAVSFLTAIIQTCFFFNLRPFGFAPDLCLALTVACGVKFGSKTGGVIGLAAGFFLSAFSASGISLAALLYTVIGIVAGVLAAPETASKLSGFSLFLVGTLGGASINGLLGLVRICVIQSAAPVVSYIFKTVFPEMLCTLVFSPIIYLLAAIVAQNLRKRQGLSAK